MCHHSYFNFNFYLLVVTHPVFGTPWFEHRSGHSTVKYIINKEEEEEKRKGVEMPDILSISSPETCMCENNSTIVRSFAVLVVLIY